ncbi:MAG TPA: RNA-binding protein [Bacteroidales bacterium]|nr:RNA-binding protein [Bacteroidales bacterium]HRZ49399.1 RNA-binding protein [Bacteroidales bacterium]
MNLFVAKMNRKTTPDDLKRLFEAYGEVLSVKIIQDRASGLSKGYGFIEMASEDAAELAIANLNETTFQEAVIVVKKANPREEPPPRRKPVLKKNVPGSPPESYTDPEVPAPETED